YTLHDPRQPDDQAKENAERDAPGKARKDAPDARPCMIKPSPGISRRGVGCASDEVIPDRDDIGRRRHDISPAKSDAPEHLPENHQQHRKADVLKPECGSPPACE